MEKEKQRSTIIIEFEKAIKERISNDSLSFLYQKLFFGFFISEEELENILEEYREVFLKEPDDWFRQFHKMIRQCDFFHGHYTKTVDILTEEEIKRRNYLLDYFSKQETLFRDNKTPEAEELRKLNSKYRSQKEVPVGGIADVFLYELINIDSKNELKHVMEITFKICS